MTIVEDLEETNGLSAKPHDLDRIVHMVDLAHMVTAEGSG